MKKMVIEERHTFPLLEVISTLDVMIDLASVPTDGDTVQLSLTSLTDTLLLLQDKLKTVELKLTPMP